MSDWSRRNARALVRSFQPYGLAQEVRFRTFAGEDLRGQVFTDRDDLLGADMHGADLTEARLVNLDLREADLSGCCLRGARLDHANLSGADLTGGRGGRDR